MKRGSLVIIGLSEAFSDIWQELADGLSVELQWLAEETGMPAKGDVAAVIVAAGGAEREAMDWLDQHGQSVGPPVFVVGADTGRRTALRMVARGASDYFALPDDLEILRNEAASAIDRYVEGALSTARHAEGVQDAAFAGIVGESVVLREELRRAERVMQHRDASVLIVGETGTGKELLARVIHEGGSRSAAPFVPVNCSALPANLVESELFGHEKGAFTGAHAAKPGLFEMADGGTLFLDEVGTMPLDVQAKLLRVLEDKEVRRVGATKSRKVDIRILAATNVDMEEEIRNGTFRADLYFRLAVITLTVPPLRDRGDDVLLLAQDYLERLAELHQVPLPPLSAEVSNALRGYDWPGNVRELRNAIERALLLSPPGELDVGELLRTPVMGVDEGSGAIPFPASLLSITEAAARAMLELCDGNRSEAARRLEISRQRLSRILGKDPKTQTKQADLD